MGSTPSFFYVRLSATVNESTGCSPNLQMLGREVTLLLDLMYPQLNTRSYYCQVEYVEYVQENFKRARGSLHVAAERQKKYYDQRTQNRVFAVGD